jgi:hypothetical protein
MTNGVSSIDIDKIWCVVKIQLKTETLRKQFVLFCHL